MPIKKFSQFIQESFNRDEERRLRDLGLGPTRWAVVLSFDYFYVVQTSPAQFSEDFADWIADDFSTGGWRIDPATIELDDWKPEAFDVDDDNYAEPPGVLFTLTADEADAGAVKAWLKDNLLGRVFDEINDLQKIEADEAY